MIRASYLKSMNKIIAKESKHAFLRGVTGDLRTMLLRRLEIKHSNHEDGEPFEIEIVFKEVDFILGGASFNAQSTKTSFASFAIGFAIVATSSKPIVTVKKEDVNLASIMNMLKSFQEKLNAIERRGSTMRASLQGGVRPVCAFCEEQGHFVRSCAIVGDYIRVGKCRRDKDGHVILSDENYIASVVSGRNIKERIDNLAAKRNQAVNMIIIMTSAAFATSRNELATSRNELATIRNELATIRNELAMNVTIDEGEEDQDEVEIQRIEYLLREAKKKARARKERGDQGGKSSVVKEVSKSKNELTAQKKVSTTSIETSTPCSEVARSIERISIKAHLLKTQLMQLNSQCTQHNSQLAQIVLQRSQCSLDSGCTFLNDESGSTMKVLSLRTDRALVEDQHLTVTDSQNRNRQSQVATEVRKMTRGESMELQSIKELVSDRVSRKPSNKGSRDAMKIERSKDQRRREGQQSTYAEEGVIEDSHYLKSSRGVIHSVLLTTNWH